MQVQLGITEKEYIISILKEKYYRTSSLKELSLINSILIILGEQPLSAFII